VSQQDKRKHVNIWQDCSMMSANICQNCEQELNFLWKAVRVLVSWCDASGNCNKMLLQHVRVDQSAALEWSSRLLQLSLSRISCSCNLAVSLVWSALVCNQPFTTAIWPLPITNEHLDWCSCCSIAGIMSQHYCHTTWVPCFQTCLNFGM